MILKRKAFRSLIAILIVIACITSNLFVATADKVAEKGNIDVAVDTSKGKNSYSVYLSKNSKSEYSSEDVICKLNDKIIEKESVDFKINVEKDGLYALGMSYKALDDDMSEICIGLKIDGKFLYANMKELEFPRFWCDTEGLNADALGNEYVPEQELYGGYAYSDKGGSRLQGIKASRRRGNLA
jgi:hypothetical protein